MIIIAGPVSLRLTYTDDESPVTVSSDKKSTLRKLFGEDICIKRNKNSFPAWKWAIIANRCKCGAVIGTLAMSGCPERTNKQRKKKKK